MEYYPEEALAIATKNPRFAQKVEQYLTEVVRNQTARSFLNLSSAKRFFLSMYVYEHFKLDMCSYKGMAADKAVTDVFWKEGCKVPEILVSEVIDLIEKGALS